MATTTTTTDPNLPAYTKDPRGPRLGRIPFWMIALGLVGLVASWVPLVIAARSRVTPSEQPRIHIFQDMAYQPRHRPQAANDMFADGRGMRPRIAGTVARGRENEDDHFHRGFTKPAEAGAPVKWFDEFPKEVKVTPDLLARGQERYNIYCALCHGYDGYGNGPVHNRAKELEELKWVQPANLHTEQIRMRQLGHIYNTINIGIRNMPGYGAQVGAMDRWAIVAYVRAMQLTQNNPAGGGAQAAPTTAPTTAPTGAPATAPTTAPAAPDPAAVPATTGPAATAPAATEPATGPTTAPAAAPPAAP